MSEKQKIPPYFGYDYQRLEHNPCEKILANSWAAKEQSGSAILPLLLGRNPTTAEIRAAASAIQWLGTNCGYSWLAHVLQQQNIIMTSIYSSEPSQWWIDHAATDSERFRNAIEYGIKMDEWLRLHPAELQLAFDLSEPT